MPFTVSNTFTYSFIHVFSSSVFIKHLLYSSHTSKYQGHRGKQPNSVRHKLVFINYTIFVKNCITSMNHKNIFIKSQL